jgi:hypothetical protein
MHLLTAPRLREILTRCIFPKSESTKNLPYQQTPRKPSTTRWARYPPPLATTGWNRQKGGEHLVIFAATLDTSIFCCHGQGNARLFFLERCDKGKLVARRGRKASGPLLGGGSRAAEQSGRASRKALLWGKEGDGALSYCPWHSIPCEVSAEHTQRLTVCLNQYHERIRACDMRRLLADKDNRESRSITLQVVIRHSSPG